MRTSGVLFAAIAIALLTPTYTHGQSSDPRATEEQPEPYHKHRDTHQGHDHFYPDRGSILRDAPQGSIVVNYAGLSYRFHDGVWLEPRGPAFMVVAPPIGLVVPTLPTFATVLAHGGEIYLYCNEVYYLPRPDLNGYEVINDPAETAAKPKSDAALAGPVSGKLAAAPRAATQPPATAATTAEDDNGEPAVVTPAAIPVARAVGAAPAVVSSAGSAGLAASALSPASAISPAAVGTSASVSSPATAPVGMAMRSAPVPSTPSTTPAVSTSSATPSNVAPTAASTGPTTSPTTGPPASITVAAATPPGPGPASVTAAPISTPTAAPSATAPPSVTAAPSATAPPSASPALPTTAVPSATAPIAVPVAATAPVTLPTTSSSTATADPPKGIRATLYPKNGQSADQLAHDRYDCYRFAVAQTGFDPVRSGSATSATASQQQYDYDRAQSACFEARGYTVR
jgi:hypothetical protein